ncbi:MAG TPA: NHL repeat-containing protein [Ignavibacteria bacterium]
MLIYKLYIFFVLILFTIISISVDISAQVKFVNAVSMTIDGKGNVYVLDNETNEIVKLSGDLSFQKKIGKKGWLNGEFDTPTFIDGSSGLDIYLCDGKNFRIQRFDLNLSYVSSLYTNTETFDNNLKFNRPISSVILNSADLYVIDGDNSRIVKFINGSAPILSFAGFQEVEGSLSKPGKILKDSYNSIYVQDKGRNSVMKYDNFGNFVKSIKYDSLLSFSIYKDNLFLLNSEMEIIVYDIKKQAYIGKIEIMLNNNPEEVRDFLVFDTEKFLILEKSKINFYKF